MIAVWPWTLTPLTARVAGAMFALPGLVGLGIALDRRWSAARIILQAQAISDCLHSDRGPAARGAISIRRMWLPGCSSAGSAVCWPASSGLYALMERQKA